MLALGSSSSAQGFRDHSVGTHRRRVAAERLSAPPPGLGTNRGPSPGGRDVSKAAPLVLRHPKKLDQAWERQREERRYFIAFFGSDLVVIPGRELADRLRAFNHCRTYEARDAEVRTTAEWARQSFGTVPQLPELKLPDFLVKAETVGVIYDEVERLLRRRSRSSKLAKSSGITTVVRFIFAS